MSSLEIALSKATMLSSSVAMASEAVREWTVQRFMAGFDSLSEQEKLRVREKLLEKVAMRAALLRRDAEIWPKSLTES